uniref:Uncharacterized protein n=1 Tax=Panagrolaimus davidi TaxID=227884 RepID=A0A914QB54_9BILA
MDIPLKRTQFFSTFCQQSFSLPVDSIIYYILKNPKTPELYQKLIKTCKYFFLKNSILIVSRLWFQYRNDWYTIVNEKRIKFKNISSKIWVTGAIEIYQNQNEQSRIPSLIPKLYQCENKHLNLSYGNILFKDFKFLASKCDYIWLYDSTVINENDSIVSLEKIIEILPNINDFK